MISAYEGKEPYIFVSYAHKDSPIVFHIIEKLSARGYRIWYDEGIEPGSEWPEYIANHLIGAEMVLSFLTPNAVESVNCRREINFALSKDKPVLAIYMDKFDVPAGIELQLSSQQNILYYNYDSEERFLDKIETCQYLLPCRTGDRSAETAAAQSSATPAAKGTPSPSRQSTASHAPQSAPSPSSPQAKKPQAKIILAAGVCIAALMIFFFINSGKKKSPEPNNTSVETTAGDETSAPTGDETAVAAGDDANASANDAPTGDETDAPTSTWNYTISRSEESTTYSFARGPQIVLPASWGSQVTVIDEGNHVSFYHTASMEAWEVDGYDNTGYLFKLYLDPTQDYKNLPSFMDLGKTSEGYFYLMFPTDFQAYADNERIMNQYQELYSEIEYVKINSHMAE